MADSEETRRALRRRVRAEERLLLVVAGPNGAGKSTFVETFLKPTGFSWSIRTKSRKGCHRTPRKPSPTKLPVWQIRGAVISVARGVSFCMETVFSDPYGAKLDFLRECQSQGYVVC